MAKPNLQLDNPWHTRAVCLPVRVFAVHSFTFSMARTLPIGRAEPMTYQLTTASAIVTINTNTHALRTQMHTHNGITCGIIRGDKQANGENRADWVEKNPILMLNKFHYLVNEEGREREYCCFCCSPWIWFPFPLHFRDWIISEVHFDCKHFSVGNLWIWAIQPASIGYRNWCSFHNWPFCSKRQCHSYLL